MAKPMKPVAPVTKTCIDRARDAIDLGATTVDATAGIVEHAILGEDLVDGGAPARGVVFTEDVVKIAGQQGRYAVGHGVARRPFQSGALPHADLLLDERGPAGRRTTKPPPSAVGAP